MPPRGVMHLRRVRSGLVVPWPAMLILVSCAELAKREISEVPSANYPNCKGATLNCFIANAVTKKFNTPHGMAVCRTEKR